MWGSMNKPEWTAGEVTEQSNRTDYFLEQYDVIYDRWEPVAVEDDDGGISSHIETFEKGMEHMDDSMPRRTRLIRRVLHEVNIVMHQVEGTSE